MAYQIIVPTDPVNGAETGLVTYILVASKGDVTFQLNSQSQNFELDHATPGFEAMFDLLVASAQSVGGSIQKRVRIFLQPNPNPAAGGSGPTWITELRGIDYPY